MRTIDIYVAGRCPHDAFIQHPISLKSLENAFCFKFLSLKKQTSSQFALDSSCIDSPTVELYTFLSEGRRVVGNMDDVWERIASMYLHFLHQMNADASGEFISNQSELRSVIVTSCKKQWEGNYAHFVKTASFTDRDKRTYNICCGKLLKAVMENAPVRFRSFQYEHTYAIPFIVGDRIHFGCTIQSHHGIQRYDIRLLVSQ